MTNHPDDLEAARKEVEEANKRLDHHSITEQDIIRRNQAERRLREMEHADIRQRHSEHLRSYRQSAEFAEHAKEVGYPVPDGPLPSLIGKRWEIDKDTYWEFLEVLPPLGHQGGSFYLSEFTFGDITTKYTKEGDRYFCEFARYPERKQDVIIQKREGQTRGR